MASMAMLHRLARRAGVQSAYIGVDGRRQEASVDSVLAALRSLGHEIHRPEDAGAALRAADERRWSRLCDEVLVVRAPARSVRLRRPTPAKAPAIRRVITIDDDGTEQDLPATGAADVFLLPDALEIGRHRLHVEGDAGATGNATLLVSPERCWAPDQRELGAMMPLYAMRPRPEERLGLATYSDLGEAAAWTGRSSASLFGTLPLLAGFLGQPHDPSPYSPISRERWNELYIDFTQTPEFAASERVRSWFNMSEQRTAAAQLGAADLIDYRRIWDVIRPGLDVLAQSAWEQSARREALIRRAKADPGLVRYAAFRAWCEEQQAGWKAWREPMPERPLDDWLEWDRFRTWLYAQAEADDQLKAAQHLGEVNGCGLYLDLPVGVSSDGFDTWSEPETFANGFSVGAPPDMLFAHGQNWGFRPPDPKSWREAGHEPFRRILSAHGRHCSTLRIDHVMMLHRLFWIPDGGAPADGVYVRYPARELYAMLAIESHRWRMRIVGENLGTVPCVVERDLPRWGMLGMSVAQFDLRPGEANPLPAPAEGDLACLGTHDTAPFAGFWTDRDVALNREMGIIDSEAASNERARRDHLRGVIRHALGVEEGLHEEEEIRRVIDGMLAHLAEGDAAVLLVTLEDLWGERMPQNVPGVPTDQYPSWHRRIDAVQADFMERTLYAERLARMARLRTREVVPEGASGR